MSSFASRALRFATAALCVVALAGGAVAQEDEPAPTNAHLVVHKSVAEDQLVIGQNMTIKIEVYNAGGSPAKKVQLTDPGWESEHFDVLGPATSATYDIIEPGASERLEFVVVPRVSGQFSAGPSLVTYAPGKGPTISGTSNALPRIPILSITDKHIETAISVGAVVTLGFCTTLDDWRRAATYLAVAVALLGCNWIALRGKSAMSANRRRKAIAELTKDE